MIEQEFESRTIKIKRSKRGLPCFWQNTKTFDAMSRKSFVFDKDLNEREPIFTRKTGDTLVPVFESDIIIKIFYEQEGVEVQKSEGTCTIGSGIGISILQVKEISKYGNGALADIILRKPSENSEWSTNKLSKIETVEVTRLMNILNSIL